jgi:hypothetical protein
MVPSHPLITVLATALLLGGCGKKDAAESATQDAPARDSAAATTPEGKKLDYWPLVAPVVAATSGGTGQCLPSLQKVEGAAITIGADGKVSAPGFEVNLRNARQVAIHRELRGTAYRASAMLSDDADKGTLVSLIADGTAEKNGASIMRDGKQLMCGETPGLEKLASKPLYPLVAKVLEASSQTLKCIDTKTLRDWHTMTLKVANGIVTLGKDSYDLRQATLESVQLSEGGNQLSYAFTTPQELMVYIFYDATGKVTNVQGRGKTAAVHACEPQA